jgi:hypothetical protein
MFFITNKDFILQISNIEINWKGQNKVTEMIKEKPKLIFSIS